MEFANKVVIVTGASNGIGRAIAKMYAEKGAKVVLADIDKGTGESAVEEIRFNRGEALFQETDVRKEEEIIQLMRITKETYGRIDILINNAGKGLFKSPYEVTIEEWDELIHTNLRSVFLGTREAAKYIRENQEGGAVVNISSTRAMMSEAFSELYAASKGGIVSITHAFAHSLSGDQITVNAISPGWIETGDYSLLQSHDHEQHLSKRVGTPEDIARACIYLTSKENNFITGTNLVIDGGMTKKMIYEE